MVLVQRHHGMLNEGYLSLASVRRIIIIIVWMVLPYNHQLSSRLPSQGEVNELVMVVMVVVMMMMIMIITPTGMIILGIRRRHPHQQQRQRGPIPTMITITMTIIPMDHPQEGTVLRGDMMTTMIMTIGGYHHRYGKVRA